MLTKLSVYDPAGLTPDPLELSLTPEGRLPSDIVQVSNIAGLEPVKAVVSTAPYGSIDGSSYSGSNVADRNIVIDLLPQPDWENWNIVDIRNQVYKYFMPQSFVRLVFESTERPPVEIFGHVESCEPNIFSKDNEIQVSIICPHPHFKAIDPVVIPGQSNDLAFDFEYGGTIVTGTEITLSRNTDPGPSLITIEFVRNAVTYAFLVDATVDATKNFLVSSTPGNKFVQNIPVGGGEPTNLLSKVRQGSVWPTIDRGRNYFTVTTDEGGVQDWELKFYERYGGL